MRSAIELARKGTGHVSPNPPVGALVVKNGKIIAKGYHPRFGGPHAEAVALRRAGKRARGATLYVTLEPCCTLGKTPPCIETVIHSGIKKLVVGVRDPNPKHAGRGLRIAARNGIQVTEGVQRQAAAELIGYFAHWIRHQTPYVIVKEAMTLDGKIATRSGDSRWISSIESRKQVHALRSGVDAVLVGKNTLIKDNPRLTSRGNASNSHQPVRIVVDPMGKLPLGLKVFSSRLPGETWVVCSASCPQSVQLRWKQKGITVVPLKGLSGKIKTGSLLKELGKKGIVSLLVEGGGETAYSFLAEKKVQKMFLFVAPKFLGGRHAPTVLSGAGVSKIKDAFRPKSWSWKPSGKDLLIEAEF